MKKNEVKKLALLCSGGDSPGMNCAIRSVVRTAIAKDIEVVGIERGYAGLLEKQFIDMDASSVGNIMQHGGTVLQTSRCLEFHEPETRKKAFDILKEQKIDGLIVIGGNGSFNGAYLLHKEHGLPVVGIPGTIDNDIAGTDYTIGFNTAVQTAVEAVDKIRDTAFSHARTFVVEVMGRKSPQIALHVGICTGAENIVFPTEDINYDQIVSDIKRGMKRGKNSSIIIVAEGNTPGLSYQIQQTLRNDYEMPAHVCILGHIQRGGNPSALDRFLASRMGYEAVKAMQEGKTPVVTGFVDGHVRPVEFEKCLKNKNENTPEHIDLVHTLSI